MYAAFKDYGGVGGPNVRTKVLVGSSILFRFAIKRLALVTPWALSALRTSASSQSRNSRHRIMPRLVFREQWAVTLTGWETQLVICRAVSAWFLFLTSTRTDPLRSFFARLMSPMAHNNSFCILNIDKLIGCSSVDVTTRYRENSTESEYLQFFVSSIARSLMLSCLKTWFEYGFHRPQTPPSPSSPTWGCQRCGLNPGAWRRGLKVDIYSRGNLPRVFYARLAHFHRLLEVAMKCHSVNVVQIYLF